jgi:ABC-type polysaccharide/polyol phosphate transport system ATPase subunit
MADAVDNGSGAVAVRAKDLRKHYLLGEHQSLGLTVTRLLRRGEPLPRLEALGGIDFATYRGEAFGIVGPNGSGKSTLLQILAGATLPTSGELKVTGRVVPLLAVGQCFHPELTGRENVTLFASSLRIPRSTIKARMDAVTEFAELDRHMDTPVKRYSSGMISRLSFSIAMQFPADIYVFDEVLAVVDGEFRARCLDAIKSLRRSGRTVIFVSHSLNQVAELCERVMWLEQGVVQDIGPSSIVLDAYQRMHATPTR